MSTAGLLWREWFTEKIKANAISEFSGILGLLRRNGLLSLVARKWIREQIAGGESKDEVDIEAIKIQEHEYKENEIKKNSGNSDIEAILESNYINNSLLSEYVTNEVLSMKWANRNWSESVPQLYLNNKDKYDIVKVSIITVGEKENKLLNEIYHAINNNEYTFDDSFRIYKNKIKGTSKGPNVLKLNEVKPQLREVIRNCKLNKISQPFRIEGKMAMIMLHEIEECGLTREIEKDIVEKQLNEFLDYGVDRLCDYLCRNNVTTQG